MRAAILGTGFMGRVHLEGVRRLGTVEAEMVSPRSDWKKELARFDAVHVCTPNALHVPMARTALEAGKHVLCEKPLATSASDAQELVKLASAAGLRNCTCQNLRFYPMVQQMRAMREAGELGEILVVQGTYSQDWLLYDTDWNWRIESKDSGPSRALADIGSHWCDMAEHVTGERITSLCADLQTFHTTRKKPKESVETFTGKMLSPDEYETVAIDTEDFAAVVFRMGDRARGAFTVSQVSAGRKNRLHLEVFGSKGSVAWDQERPDELWMGSRNSPNRIIVKDPSLLLPGASPYADLPGGHSEGYDDTFKQIFRRFYRSIEHPQESAQYPQFEDGFRQLTVLEAELASHQSHGWVEVPS
jgi:predicted dehydrogenase